MAVQLICPSLKCRKFLSVTEDARGKLVRCQHCQTMFRVPSAKGGETAGARAGKPVK
jgi:LSD1 subclass zinc finger protein